MAFTKEKLPSVIAGLGLDDHPGQQEFCLWIITNLAVEGEFCNLIGSCQYQH